MNPRFRKVAAFLGTAALATGVGVAVASQGGETSSPQPAMTRQAGGPGDGRFAAELAEQLGVSESKLDAAMEAARSSAGRPGDPTAMAAALAKELGLSTDKVTAALESEIDGTRDVIAGRATG